MLVICARISTIRAEVLKWVLPQRKRGISLFSLMDGRCEEARLAFIRAWWNPRPLPSLSSRLREASPLFGYRNVHHWSLCSDTGASGSVYGGDRRRGLATVVILVVTAVRPKGVKPIFPLSFLFLPALPAPTPCVCACVRACVRA